MKRTRKRSKHGGYALLRRVSEGRLDGRTRAAWAIRRMRDSLAKDLGAGTYDGLSMQQRLLVDQAALMALVCGVIAESSLAAGIITKSGKLVGGLGVSYLAWANAMRRHLETLGLERQAKKVLDVGAHLAQQLRDKAQDAAQEPDDTEAPTAERSGAPGADSVSLGGDREHVRQ